LERRTGKGMKKRTGKRDWRKGQEKGIEEKDRK
jgi:hypothetical protein